MRLISRKFRTPRSAVSDRVVCMAMILSKATELCGSIPLSVAVLQSVLLLGYLLNSSYAAGGGNAGSKTDCYGTGGGPDQFPIKADPSHHRWTWKHIESGTPPAGFEFENVSTDTKSPATGFFLGGLVSLSEIDENGPRCRFTWASKSTAIVFVEAFQLAAKWVMDEIVEKDPSFADVVAGVEIHDSCHSGKVSLESAINMVNRPEPEVDSVEAGAACRREVPIVVGPTTSSELLIVTSVLSAYKVPHITYWATSRRFDKKYDFPYLFRTVSSDHFQWKAMGDVLNAFNWSFVSVLGSADHYGRAGIIAFQNAIGVTKRACSYRYMSGEFSFNNVPQMESLLIETIREFPAHHMHGSSLQKPNVIALICGPRYARALFKTLENLATTGPKDFRRELQASHIVWLASDGWISSVEDYAVFSGRDPAFGVHSVIGFEQMIPHSFLETHSNFLRHLSRHLQQLTASKEAVARNPWIVPVIENAVGCSFNASSECTSDVCSIPCDENMSVSSAVGIDIDHLPTPLSTGSLWLAIRAALFAIWEVHRTLDAIPSKIGEDLRFELLRGIGCDTDTTPCNVFDENQDLPPGHHMLMLKREGKGRISVRKVARWQLMGKSHGSDASPFYCEESGSSELSSCATFASADNRPPSSRCASPCMTGHYRKASSLSAVDGLGLCCWHCMTCGTRSVSNGTSEDCTECLDVFTEPNTNRTACVKKQARPYAQLLSQLVIWPLAVSGLCLMVVMYTLLWQKCDSLLRTTDEVLNTVLLLCLAMSLLCAVLEVLPFSTCLTCSMRSVLVPQACLNPIILIALRSLYLVHCTTVQPDIPKWIVSLSRRLGAGPKTYLLVFAGCSMCSLSVHLAWTIVDVRCGVLAMPSTSDSSDTSHVYSVCEDRSLLQIISSVLLFLVILTAVIVAVACRKACPPRNMGVFTQHDPSYNALSLASQLVLFVVMIPALTMVDQLLFPTVIAAELIVQAAVVWMCIFMRRLLRVRGSSQVPDQGNTKRPSLFNVNITYQPPRMQRLASLPGSNCNSSEPCSPNT